MYFYLSKKIEWRIFTCNWIFLHFGITSFTQVKNLSTSSTAGVDGGSEKL